VTSYIPPAHHWGTKPHDDYPETTKGPYRPLATVTHHWGTRKHEDYADTVFNAYRPYPMLAHHWGTRKHADYAVDVFGRKYQPDRSLPHLHWGTRYHKDYTNDVFGGHYEPDASIPHHWGTRSHGDYANDVFRQYQPDPSYASHYGTRLHQDYVRDVYGHAYQPDPVFPYHWGTRKHRDYANDVFDRPFVSWDMPYGVAPPRAGGFTQDISPSENAAQVMKAGAENKSAEWGYGWTGVSETGPGGTFKSWWPPGNRQQDVMGNGGNAVPTIRGDEGPNNYRIPFHDYIAQYANVGNQGPPPIARFADMDKPISWKAPPAKFALQQEAAKQQVAAKAAAQLRLKAKAHILSERQQGAAAESKVGLGDHSRQTHVSSSSYDKVGLGEHSRQTATATGVSAVVKDRRAGLAGAWLHARPSGASAGAGHWVWEPSRSSERALATGHYRQPQAPSQQTVLTAMPGLGFRQTALTAMPWHVSHPLMRAVAQRIAERSQRREEGEARPPEEREEGERHGPYEEQHQQEAENAAVENALGGPRRQETVDGKAKSGVAWGYAHTGGNGPSKWGSLSPQFASCSAGHQQSPINLEGVGTRVSGLLHIQGLFWETPPSAEPAWGGMLGNGGGTIYDPSDSDEEGGGDGSAEAGPPSFSVLRQGGLQLVAQGMRPVLVYEKQRFALEKMYLHTPSEHTVDGVPADAELQIMVTTPHTLNPSS